MKKLTHIAAPVALTALLSACAAPGPEQVTLENLGPGVLEMIQDETAKTLTNPGPDGGLSPVQQAAQDALTKPGDNNTPSMLQLAVQKAVQDELGKKEDALVREMEFNFGGLHEPNAERVRKMMRDVVDEMEMEMEYVYLDKEKKRSRMRRKDGEPLRSDIRNVILAKLNKPGRVEKEVGIPVGGKPNEKPARFKTEYLQFATIEGAPKQYVQLTCGQTTIDLTTEVVVAPEDEAWVFNSDGELAPGSVAGRVTITQDVLQVQEGRNCVTPPLESIAGKLRPYYIVVYSDDRRLAQYHTYHPATDATDTQVAQFTLNRPACPTQGTGKKDWPRTVAVEAMRHIPGIRDCKDV